MSETPTSGGPGAPLSPFSGRSVSPVTPDVSPLERRGMFGVAGSGDTSGFGGLAVQRYATTSTPEPWGGWYDDAVATLRDAVSDEVDGDPLEAVVVEHGEITLHVRREALLPVLARLRDDPALRYVWLSSVSGVDYLGADPRRFHVVYHLANPSNGRRVRVEVSVTEADPHVPSATGLFPTADFQERETYDFFGVVFDGHPALTRIQMPDDWDGHPQRKDYPLGGVAVEYKGAEVPPPDERRAYA